MEYVLYMWQLEDTLRAYHCDAERVASDYVARFAYPPAELQAEAEWLGHLCRMMREEQVAESGHLRINQGTVALMHDLHLQLLGSDRQPDYAAAYARALPFIVELRSRNGHTHMSETENCLELLYGIIVLRMQKREVSPETAVAVTHVSRLMALLADAWHKERTGELEL